MVYPGATPEFRILIKADGTQVFQIRHVNISHRYTGKWQDVPVVLESVENVENVENTGVTNGIDLLRFKN